MDISATLASQLYAKAQAAAKPAALPAETPRPAPAKSFEAAASDFMQTLRQGEETVQAGLAGRAEPQAVVEALAATEFAVQTATAIRDKVVEAYKDILQMPV